MSFLVLASAQGPVALNLHALVPRLAPLLALGQEVTASVDLPVQGTTEQRTGLVWPHVPLTQGETQLTATLQGGVLTASGVPITRTMLHLRVDETPGTLRPCIRCNRMTGDEEHLCWTCRTEYRHYVTTGGLCPACGEMGIIRRVHDSGSSAWESCVKCTYDRALDPQGDLEQLEVTPT